MTRILIIGASRGIGRAATDEALARGHTVRAMARSVTDLVARPGLEPFAGDATDAAMVAAALEGMEAVLLALGIPKTAGSVLRPVQLFSRATAVLVAAMEARGPRRLVAVTGLGAGESRAALSGIERLGHDAVLGRIYADKTRQEAIIRASGLDWTILRPGILTNGRRSGRARVLVEPREWRNGLVSRADVAAVMLRALEDGAWIGRTPVVVT
jgi:uncharacterized protein YbjT (DUF2867 family)